MTREETNRKISELRGWQSVKSTDERYWMLIRPASEDAFRSSQLFSISESESWMQCPDWRSDALWPTLLREVPGAVLAKRICTTNPSGECWMMIPSYNIGASTHYSDPGEAVCDAWIRRRESTAK